MIALVERLRRSVIPAVPVPFTRRGAIDTEAQSRYAAWMTSHAVGAVAVWAHTGRGLHLTDEQRDAVLSCWSHALGATPIVCGVGIPAGMALPSDARALTDRVIDLTCRIARATKTAGGAAVLLHPPAPFATLPDAEQRVVELHGAVAEVGLPVIAFFLYEEAGGLAYTRETVERTLNVDGVIGIKLATLDSVMTFHDLAAAVRSFDDRLLITGEDRFLGYSLMMGADAALIGMAAACTDVCVGLVESWFAGQHDRFLRLSSALDAFAAATFVDPMEGYVQRMLWALCADGVVTGDAHDPFGPGLPPGERDAVARAVRALRDAS